MANLGHDRICCVSRIHSVKILPRQPFPSQAPKNILCVGFNVDFFVAPLFLLLESTHSPLFMDLFPKSKSRNDEAGKYTQFYEVRDIKYSSNMQIRFLNSLFVHESWVDVKTVQELHSQSFHPRFLGSNRAPAWALTFLWLVRGTSEPACHRNNQTYYSETHCQQASGRESKRVQI